MHRLRGASYQIQPIFVELEPGKVEPAGMERTGKYDEAPMLADLEAAGKLPPMEERFPIEPVVIARKEHYGSNQVYIRKEYQENLLPI